MNMISILVMLPSFSATFTFSLLLNLVVTFGANNTDQLALLAIKSKIINDPGGVLTSWNDSLHFCQWQGVTCGRRHKRVTVLDLSSKRLVGSLSPYLGNLSFLREIHLQNNKLEGGIPHEVGRLLRLQQLRLNNNSFEGGIPANLSHCSNLRFLGLGYNNLSGKIPRDLRSLLMLKTLSINHNFLTGQIPHFIANFTSLESLSLAGCHLGGSIPDAFHHLKNLRRVGLMENDLIGTIPSSFYNLSLLNILSVPDNKLHGSLPTNFGLMLPHLQMLQLGMNHFSGSLPPSMSNLSELQIFDVGMNHFDGKIGINFRDLHNLGRVVLGGNNFQSGELDDMKMIESLSNCSSLEVLDLSSCQLRGKLPNYLGNFSTKLYSLSLSKNSISGSLPSSIGNLFSLTGLYLAENQFTGTIPSSIGRLQNLQQLDLSENNFSGKIPDSIGNLSLLILLYINENKLDGTIPSSLGNCQNLAWLSLFQNNISGSIPIQLFRLPSIQLNLGRNHLSGRFPLEVGNLKHLNDLSLVENDLSGELPSTLGSCISLETLYLGGNFFHGSIPPSMSSLRALQELDLTSNNFSGEIPKYFEGIPLKYLDLSYNNFEGEVSVKGVFANESAVSVVGNKRLCGGIPELQLPKCRIKDLNRHRKLSLALIIAISILSTLFSAAMVSFVVYCWLMKKRKDRSSGPLLKESFLRVSYAKLLKATEGFSSANFIGAGSFASVYKGILDGDGGVVAVKLLNLRHRGGYKSFIAECEALRTIRHRNLVKVITCCSSVDFQGNDFKAIVYEFMPNGSLEMWLHSSTRTQNEQDELPRLGLLQIISIALDVACALDYLHHCCEKTIIHCDLKPSNILLDGDMVAHVGDFGLAKFLLPEIKNANQSSSVGVRGTIGYAAPEYGLGSEVSTSGDVYSYGIFLLEMVTGKKPTDPMFQDGLNLHNYASTSLANRVLEIVDPMLLNTNDDYVESSTRRARKEECLSLMLKIGEACSMESPQDRMDISSVIHELHLVRGMILGIQTVP